MKYLIKQAQTYNFDPELDFWLLALIVSGGRVLSLGANEHKKGGFVEAYYDEHCNSHAELSAIKKIRRKTDLRGSKIYIVRVQRNRALAMARPCPGCQELLKAYGIKKALYSIGPNEFGKLKLTE